MVFALELKLSKTLRGLVYFVPYLFGGQSPPNNYNTKYTSPLRDFDTPSNHSNFRIKITKNYLGLPPSTVAAAVELPSAGIRLRAPVLQPHALVLKSHGRQGPQPTTTARTRRLRRFFKIFAGV